jgi:tripartite-type tricarboxylate transporter receptor subunit TctC
MIKTFLAACILFLSASISQAQKVDFIVPYSVGGPSDFVARSIQKTLSDTEVKLVVLNRPGAGGTIGQLAFLDCKRPCLLLAYQNMVDNKELFKTQPVYFMGYQSVLLVTSTPGINNLRDLEALSRQRPINFAHSNPGSNSYDVYKGLSNLIAAIEIPYKSAANVLADFLANRVDVYGLVYSGDPSFSGFIQDSNQRIIATMSRDRFQNVPTAAEQGYPITTNAWSMLLGLQLSQTTIELIRKTLPTTGVDPEKFLAGLK